MDDRERAERRKAEKQKADWEKLSRAQEARVQDRERALQEFRDRCFEVQKHVATLSTAASLLILAVYRERPFEESVLGVTLGLLALSAVIAVYGLNFQATGVRYTTLTQWYDRRIDATTSLSSSLLIMAAVTLAFFLFHIPIWVALGVLGVWFVAFLLITLIRY